MKFVLTLYLCSLTIGNCLTITGYPQQKETYNKIDKIRKVMIPEMTISRSQAITLLVNEKEKKLNGKLKA